MLHLIKFHIEARVFGIYPYTTLLDIEASVLGLHSDTTLVNLHTNARVTLWNIITNYIIIMLILSTINKKNIRVMTLRIITLLHQLFGIILESQFWILLRQLFHEIHKRFSSMRDLQFFNSGQLCQCFIHSGRNEHLVEGKSIISSKVIQTLDNVSCHRSFSLQIVDIIVW